MTRSSTTGRYGGAAPVYAEPSQEGCTTEHLRANVRANGIPGTARIDRLEDSGQTAGDDRLFTMATTVSIPGRIAVGVELPVKVAPENQGVVMSEWERI